MVDFYKEIKEIRSLIESACVLESVRNEVQEIMRDHKHVVVDGEHADSKIPNGYKYDVVVISDEKDGDIIELLSRRIRAKLPDFSVERIGVDGVLGIKHRRVN